MKGLTEVFKDERYINAGTNEVYRYGRKAVEKARAALKPNENGFYSIPADGGKYWTIGTSDGKYGEYAKFGDKYLSVNKAGFVWAKVGTEKADIFVEMVNHMIEYMNRLNAERVQDDEDED